MDIKELQPHRVMIIPGWVHRALIRNKLNTIDAIDYKKLRSVLSLEDLAEYVYIANKLRINNVYIAANSIDEEDAEYSNTVVPLSQAEGVAKSAMQKLQGSYPVVNNQDKELPYQFIIINNYLFIILDEGYLTHVADQANMLNFIKSCLKAHYSIMPIHKVSSTGIFELYLKYFKS